jgi:hypothetical protein
MILYKFLYPKGPEPVGPAIVVIYTLLPLQQQALPVILECDRVYTANVDRPRKGSSRYWTAEDQAVIGQPFVPHCEKVGHARR